MTLYSTIAHTVIRHGEHQFAVLLGPAGEHLVDIDNGDVADLIQQAGFISEYNGPNPFDSILAGQPIAAPDAVDQGSGRSEEAASTDEFVSVASVGEPADPNLGISEPVAKKETRQEKLARRAANRVKKELEKDQ